MALLTLLDDVRKHLADVAENPSRSLDQSLLEKFDGQIIGMSWHVV